MADEGTLATTAEVLLAIGENASSTQISEANTNIWIKWAEGDIVNALEQDVVADVGDLTTRGARYLAAVAANRAAFYAIQQDQNSWSLSTTQSKLNIIYNIWTDAVKILKDKDKRAFLGLD